jgi:glycosyltransferase involved in cell wall biosynthesis
MEEKPLVTVITLSYNSQFLKETVDSLLSQDYPHIQYIVSDDASNEFDCSFWQAYINERSEGNIDDLVITRLDSHKGTVRNYNSALNLAKGDYIFPLSSDDVFCTVSSLSQWVDAFIKSNSMVLGARCDIYDVTMSKYLGTWPNLVDSNLLKEGSIEKIYERLEYQKIIPGCSLARTKESIKVLGCFDEKYILLEDYPFILQTLRKGVKIGYADIAVIKHRRGGVSDPAQLDPILNKDMELLYSEDIYPFSKDPSGLKKHLEKTRAEETAKRAFYTSWNSMSFIEKLASIFKHPIWTLKIIYKRLFRH